MLDDGDALSYDYLILAPGATHSYFGHDEWAAHAPGLKTLDDALAMRRRMLLAFEEAERERDPDAQAAPADVRLIGGGPTGVELAGALAEIARHTLRHEFDTIDPESARIILIEAGPTILPAFPAVAARFGAARAAQARRRGLGERARSPSVEARRA